LCVDIDDDDEVTIRGVNIGIHLKLVFVVVEDFIKAIRVMFDRGLDIVRDVRSNDIIELLRGYIGIFTFDDEIQFLK
jgi:hypothetical protein